MTSPRVIELPRRLEPVGRDTFLCGEGDALRPVSHLGNVVPLRSRDAVGLSAAPPPPHPPLAA